MNNQEIAERVYHKYHDFYKGEVQGCCPIIADEIRSLTGGVCVAGEIIYNAGARRSHWWVEADGETLDPMGDDFMSWEDFAERVEVHRDQAEFEAVLPRYERRRV